MPLLIQIISTFFDDSDSRAKTLEAFGRRARGQQTCIGVAEGQSNELWLLVANNNGRKEE